MLVLKKVEAEKAVAAFVSAVTGCLKQGDKLSLVGFGTFSTSKRAARKGQNPQTGKKINYRCCYCAQVQARQNSERSC
jgi:DNA-binding protein HU-beta